MHRIIALPGWSSYQLSNFEVTLYSFMIVEDQLTIIDGVSNVNIFFC